MANTWTSKYGTKINISGLTPEQIKQVQSTAQDKGAYGTKASALADSFRRKGAGVAGATPAAGTTPATTTTPQTGTTVPGGTPNLGIDAKTGAVNPNSAITSIFSGSIDDTVKNFAMNNPGAQTDALGNTQNISFDPVTGKTSISQGAGQGLSTVNQAFTNAAAGLSASGKEGARDAAFNYLTRNLQTDKAREMEAAKQELAERGIPIDPRPGSLWSKSMESIDRKYQDLTDQAQNRAWELGNQSYATDTSAVQALGSTVAGQMPTFTQYQGGQSTIAPTLMGALQTIAGFNMEKYKTDKAYRAEMDRIAVQRLAASKSGGGGGGNDTGDLFIG